jgi:hypothetical protein
VCSLCNTKLSKMRWVGHATRVVDEKYVQNELENIKGIDHLRLEGSIILKCILQKQETNVWAGLIWLEFQDWIIDCQFLKMDSVSWSDLLIFLLLYYIVPRRFND